MSLVNNSQKLTKDYCMHVRESEKFLFCQIYMALGSASPAAAHPKKTSAQNLPPPSPYAAYVTL